jgi:hypothetical protein
MLAAQQIGAADPGDEMIHQLLLLLLLLLLLNDLEPISS